ncbi:MAG: DUF4388 domain-containing protein [Planctomycetota bacterium]
MGLKGNLSTVSLSDVFQLLNRGRSTGVLHIHTSEGVRMIEINIGNIVAISISENTVRLGDLLRSRNLITEKQLQQALLHMKVNSVRIGEAMIQLGYLPASQIQEQLLHQLQEEICDLFLLKEGDFEFVNGEIIPPERSVGGGFKGLAVNPDAMLLEAARRSDEWKSILTHIPSSACLFYVTEAGTEYYKSAELDHQVLMTLINEERTFEACVRKSCYGRFRTGQIVSEMLDIGAIAHVPFDQYVVIADSHLNDARFKEAYRIFRYALDYIPDPAAREYAAKQMREANDRMMMASSMSTEDSHTEILRLPGMTVERVVNWPIVAATITLVIFSVIGLIVFLSSPDEIDEPVVVRPPIQRRVPPLPLTTPIDTSSTPSLSPSGINTTGIALATTPASLPSTTMTPEILALYKIEQAVAVISPTDLTGLIDIATSCAQLMDLSKTAGAQIPDADLGRLYACRSTVRNKLLPLLKTLQSDAKTVSESLGATQTNPSAFISDAEEIINDIDNVISGLDDLTPFALSDIIRELSADRLVLRAYASWRSRQVSGSETARTRPLDTLLSDIAEAVAHPLTPGSVRIELLAVQKRLSDDIMSIQGRWAVIISLIDARRYDEALPLAAVLKRDVLNQGLPDAPSATADSSRPILEAIDSTMEICRKSIEENERQVKSMVEADDGAGAEQMEIAHNFLRKRLKSDRSEIQDAFGPDDYDLTTPDIARVFYFYQAMRKQAR